MSNPPRFLLACLSTSLLLLACGGVAVAQHEPGGGTIGVSTGRPSNKPATKRGTKPASATTTPRTQRQITPAPVNKPATTGPVQTSTSAEYFYQQGEALYTSHKYREALQPYLKAVDINPSMTSALYRI